jgi:hypothetical protein
MASLGKGVTFGLTEKFWKDYRPALAPDSGLGSKLKAFEKANAAAEKVELDKNKLNIEKAQAWATALNALKEITSTMPAAIKGLEGSRAKFAGKLARDKEGLENLKDSLSKAYTLLNAHSHPVYQSLFGRQQKFAKAAMDEGKGKEKASDFTDFIDGLDDSELKDIRNWKNDIREILNKTPKQFLTSDFTNTLRVMNEWDRKGTVKSLSDEKSFKKDIARNVQNRQKAVEAFEKFFNEIFEDKTQMSIAMLARGMIQSLKAEAKWWEDFKREGESKIK